MERSGVNHHGHKTYTRMLHEQIATTMVPVWKANKCHVDHSAEWANGKLLSKTLTSLYTSSTWICYLSILAHGCEALPYVALPASQFAYYPCQIVFKILSILTVKRFIIFQIISNSNAVITIHIL